MGGAWAARVSLACPLMAQHSVQIGIGIKFARQNQDGFPGQNQVFACLAAVVLCCCVACCFITLLKTHLSASICMCPHFLRISALDLHPIRIVSASVRILDAIFYNIEMERYPLCTYSWATYYLSINFEKINPARYPYVHTCTFLSREKRVVRGESVCDGGTQNHGR
jgi:hypothetical protein